MDKADRGGAAGGRVAHPVFAALYDVGTALWERRLLQPRRAQLLEGCRGAVLDLGCGTGANFALLRPRLAAGELELTAVDPDPYMCARARLRAQRVGLAVRLQCALAEALPFPDRSFDVVLSTLVLCSVHDPSRALQEIRRVLRPGGELRFLEHVRDAGRAGSWQDRLRPAWAAIAGGCQLNRPTGALLQATFGRLDWEEWRVPFPICRVILGRCWRT